MTDRFQTGFSTEGTGEKLIPFPSGSAVDTDTDDQPAAEVPYDNSGSGLTSTDVQNALDELAAQIALISDGGLVSGSGGDLEWIATIDPVGTAVASFTGIPATFKHLLLLGSGRASAGASVGANVLLQFNGDTGNNYDVVEAQMQNQTNQSNTAGPGSSIMAAFVPWSGAPAGNAGCLRAEIINYANTDLFKKCFMGGGAVGATSAGTTFIYRHGVGHWRSLAAINRVDVILSASGNWDVGSSFSLYGIRGG